MGVTLRWLAFVPLLACFHAFAAEPALLETLEKELQRNFAGLKEKAEVKPYFIGYSVNDSGAWQVNAAWGALQSSNHSRRRYLDVTVRVGSPELDNYHRLPGVPVRFGGGAFLPLDNLPGPISREAWLETAQTHQAAVERFIRVRSNQQVKADEADRSPDFSPVPAKQEKIAVPALEFQTTQWEQRIKKWSGVFREFPGILDSGLSVSATREEKHLVDTGGNRLSHGRRFARIVINASARTADGMDVDAGDTFEAETPGELPPDERVIATVRRVGTQVEQLLKAPPAEPFAGPAILSGRAAGVFFHEIFGHRIEGHRQKDEQEGQTFTKSVGQPILPEFLSVVFDPTRREYNGEDLNGWYDFDDEGVSARKVTVVENGILKTFLFSRTPIEGFPESNGHGRRQPGAEVVARQSNLIVESRKGVPEARLREMLMEEVKRQGKPYGLYFEDITGGFTFTQRAGLQAFRVIPRVVYRVYADGRPDELIRGANIVGTPLAAFAKIIATSDSAGVFNGYCGAESGRVPVAAISPALLVSEIEIEKKQTSQQRPPFLPAPSLGEKN